MPVISYFSMGLDVADVDNDGWPDIYTTDMLPEDEIPPQDDVPFEDWERYQTKVQQRAITTSRCATCSSATTATARSATSARWPASRAPTGAGARSSRTSTSIGNKDIFVTNGIAKDVTSQDYVAFLGERADDAGRDEQRAREVDFMQARSRR